VIASNWGMYSTHCPFGTAADDPHQPTALVIIDLTRPQPFRHLPSLGGQDAQENPR
jgi:hypothetical protein